MEWSIYQNFPIQVVFLDDQVVVFHHGSGETHLLDKDASLILSIINDSEEAVSESVLLRAAIDMGFGSFDQQSLVATLGVLQNLQIIEKI